MSYIQGEDESVSMASVASGVYMDKHKKLKKKKKKREKDKNKEKHEKKHKHRHKVRTRIFYKLLILITE